MSHSQNRSYFPAEWHPQSAVHLVWPSQDSDWNTNYKSIVCFYIELVKALIGRQALLVVFPVGYDVEGIFNGKEQSKLIITYANYNDTWVRDYGGISIVKEGVPHLLDFKFNAWGNKFEWKLDNEQTRILHQQKSFSNDVVYSDQSDFVLEGGSIESNGHGLLLTTESCLLNPNRNGELSKLQIEKTLQETLHVDKVLWLKHGKIYGDDTDGHIDTLVRFVNRDTLVYVKCLDESDEHFQELFLMEKELGVLCAAYNLSMIPLPMPKAIYNPQTNERLPATYVNFLIINDAVMVPSYAVKQDNEVQSVLKTCFPDRKIISINCLALIAQGGSLHCATMQYPKGFMSGAF
ncbi:MAG: agmatine deiminase [Glaciecola sp.]|jgi:agmatine deiminase